MTNPRIIVNFNNFILDQDLMVYIDGACKRYIKVPMDKIIDGINGLKTDFDIHQIDLCGNVDFISKFKAELQTKFNQEEDMIINIYPR